MSAKRNFGNDQNDASFKKRRVGPDTLLLYMGNNPPLQLDWNNLRSVSEYAKRHEGYLDVDYETGIIRMRLDGVPSGLNTKFCPEFGKQIEGLSSFAITRKNVFDSLPWYSLFDIPRGIQKCDVILARLINRHWNGLKQMTTGSTEPLLDKLFRAAQLGISHNCPLVSETVKTVVEQMLEAKYKYSIVSSMKARHWELAFDVAQRHRGIGTIILEWLNILLPNLATGKVVLETLNDPLLPSLTETKMTLRASNRGMLKIIESGASPSRQLEIARTIHRTDPTDTLVGWKFQEGAEGSLIEEYRILFNGYEPEEDVSEDGNEPEEDVSEVVDLIVGGLFNGYEPEEDVSEDGYEPEEDVSEVVDLTV